MFRKLQTGLHASYVQNESKLTETTRESAFFGASLVAQDCVCFSEPEIFISARGHIPHFQSSLPLMTHPPPALLQGAALTLHCTPVHTPL